MKKAINLFLYIKLPNQLYLPSRAGGIVGGGGGVGGSVGASVGFKARNLKIMIRKTQSVHISYHRR